MSFQLIIIQKSTLSIRSDCLEIHFYRMLFNLQRHNLTRFLIEEGISPVKLFLLKYLEIKSENKSVIICCI
jgi:hypothetical protein